MPNWIDRFVGGSNAQGTPTTESAGAGQPDSDIYGILTGISGITGEVATTVNSLIRTPGTAASAGGPTSTVSAARPTPWLLFGAIAAAAGVVLWLILRK